MAHLGLERDIAAARDAAAIVSPAAASACVHSSAGSLPDAVGLLQVLLPSCDALTPAQALTRRRLILEQERLSRAESRCADRRIRSFQERACCRPRRRVARGVILAIANLNAFATLHEEP